MNSLRKECRNDESGAGCPGVITCREPKGEVRAIGGSFLSLKGQVLGSGSRKWQSGVHQTHLALFSALGQAGAVLGARNIGMKKVTLLRNQSLWSRKSYIILI